MTQILQAISNIAYVWCLCGLAFLPLLIVMELAAARAKGPDYANWVEQSKKERTYTVQPLRMLLFWIVIWPLVLGMWFVAAWHKQTLIERSILAEEKQQEARDARKVKAAHAFQAIRDAVGGEAGAIWLAPTFVKTRLQPYTRVTGAGDDLIITHIVFDMGEPDEPFNIVRIGLVLEENPDDLAGSEGPETTAPTLEEAVARCNKDADWNELCVSGTPTQRDGYLSSQRRRPCGLRGLPEHADWNDPKTTPPQ